MLINFIVPKFKKSYKLKKSLVSIQNKIRQDAQVRKDIIKSVLPSHEITEH